MTDAAATQRAGRGRVLAFRIVAGISGGLLLFSNAAFGLAPLFDDQEKVHSFHRPRPLHHLRAAGGRPVDHACDTADRCRRVARCVGRDAGRGRGVVHGRGLLGRDVLHRADRVGDPDGARPDARPVAALGIAEHRDAVPRSACRDPAIVYRVGQRSNHVARWIPATGCDWPLERSTTGVASQAWSSDSCWPRWWSRFVKHGDRIVGVARRFRARCSWACWALSCTRTT